MVLETSSKCHSSLITIVRIRSVLDASANFHANKPNTTAYRLWGNTVQRLQLTATVKSYSISNLLCYLKMPYALTTMRYSIMSNRFNWKPFDERFHRFNHHQLRDEQFGFENKWLIITNVSIGNCEMEITIIYEHWSVMTTITTTRFAKMQQVRLCFCIVGALCSLCTNGID